VIAIKYNSGWANASIDRSCPKQ